MSPIPALPKSLRIGPFDIAVKEMDPELGTARKEYGHYDQAGSTISITIREVSKWRVLEVLLHEISHAIYDSQGVQDSDDEERVVTAMGFGLAQVMRDNPKLRKWIEDVCSGK